DVVQLHEVKLHVLARRDVAKTPREPLRNVGQRVQLFARQDALRDLDAKHLSIVGLTLSVRAPHQSKLTPLVRGELAALVTLERRDELIDVGVARKRKSRAAERFRIIDD